jgi:hypothetical protein
VLGEQARRAVDEERVAGGALELGEDRSERLEKAPLGIP